MKKLIVQTDKLIENIHKIRAFAAESKIIAVLKGDGYGLGLCEFAQVLVKQGIDFFAVSEIDEALTLRNAGFDEDILLLACTCNKEEAEKIINNNITAAIGSEKSAMVLDQACRELNTRCKAHIKIDTGFGRYGFLYKDLNTTINTLKNLSNVDITGVFSHLSNSFGKAKDSEIQFERFEMAVSKIKEAGINTGIRHICNSSAFFRFGRMHLDAVRIGSAFLGRLSVENTLGLHKIGCLNANISDIRTLPKGFNVGYANVYTTKRPTKIAVIPVGYKDGYGVKKIDDTFRLIDVLRYIYHSVILLFEKKAIYIKIDDKRVPLLGRIGMYNIVSDITDLDITADSKVELDCNPIFIDSSIKREYN